MKNLKFSIDIQSSPAHVYDTMIHPNLLLDWLRVFSVDSSYSGDWDKGGYITFTTINENGILCGLKCVVEENNLNELIVLQPIELMEGEEFFTSPEKLNDLEKTSEKYIFEETEDGARLRIEAVVIEEQEEYFLETWPIALSKIKTMCENPLNNIV